MTRDEVKSHVAAQLHKIKVGKWGTIKLKERGTPEGYLLPSANVEIKRINEAMYQIGVTHPHRRLEQVADYLIAVQESNIIHLDAS